MNGIDLLWTVEEYLPLAILFDLIVLQFALRWGYRRHKRRQACKTEQPGRSAP